MNGASKALLGAGFTFAPCAILATPSGDPISMLMVGVAGAGVAFLLLWWLLTRAAIVAWPGRRQFVLSGAMIAGVVLLMSVLAHVTAG